VSRVSSLHLTSVRVWDMCVGKPRITEIVYVQGWPEPCIHFKYDRIYVGLARTEHGIPIYCIYAVYDRIYAVFPYIRI